MTDHTTRLALWSTQGQRHCTGCGGRIYWAESIGGGGHHYEHVEAPAQGHPAS